MRTRRSPKNQERLWRKGAAVMADWLSNALNGGIVVSLGQLSPSDTRVLERAVKEGAIVKWRGYWYPTPGDPTFGLGPLKTCYSKSNPFADLMPTPTTKAEGKP